MSNRPPRKDVGTQWRFVAPHQFLTAFTGRECRVVDNTGDLDLYPYVVEFDGGQRWNALDRELLELTPETTR